MKMPRLQGVELEDLPHCPSWLRDEATEVLVRGLALAGWPRAIARAWQPWLQELGYPRVIDCCSGSAGPVAGLLKEFPFKVSLTDRFPNPSAWEEMRRRFPGWVDFEKSPVDARCLPPDFQGVWSFFNSFHHLDPASAERVLREAVHRRQPIAIFEALERKWNRIPLVLLMPILSLTSVLWARPFRWRRLNPLIALLLTWDGLMSCFRIYDPQDWEAMIQAADPTGSFQWKIEQMRLGILPATCPYLLGRPRMFAESSSEA